MVRRLWKALPKPPSTNYDLHNIGMDPYALVPEGGLVLDVGGGETEGRYSFSRVRAKRERVRLVILDVSAMKGVSVVGDAHRIPLRSVEEMYRVLKPGGVLYMSAPFVFPYHPPPEDLFRFSMSGMRALGKAFEEIKVGYNRGPASTFCHVLVHFAAVAVSFNRRAVYGVAVDLFTWGLFWIKYLDRWIGNYEPAGVLHGSAFFLGRKPSGG